MSKYNKDSDSKGNVKKLNTNILKAAADELSNQRKFLMKDEHFSATEKKIKFLKQEDPDEFSKSVELNVKKTINFTTTP